MKQIQDITRKEQMNAEFFVFGSADGCGELTLDEFKEQILGNHKELRLPFAETVKLNYWLKKNGFDVSQPFESLPENCEHPYHLVYRKMDFERCGKCNKVLCEG